MKTKFIIIVWVGISLTNWGHAADTGAMIMAALTKSLGGPTNVPKCCSCQAENPKQRCLKCKKARYCGVACQKQDWDGHRTWCNRYQNLAKPSTLDSSALQKHYSSDEVWKESFRIYELTHRITQHLGLGGLEPDTFFDQLAITNQVAPALFYKSLKKLQSSENRNPLADIKHMLIPGIGYLSPSESAAIDLVFQRPTVYGFDIDEDILKVTKSANPSLSNTVVTADALQAETWTRYKDKSIDVVLFMHPLWASSESGRVLRHVARNLPNTRIVIINKSIREAEAIQRELVELNYQGIQRIDNIDSSFPCMSCGDKLLFPINVFTSSPITTSQNMAEDLWKIMQNNPADKEKALEQEGEHRYRFLLVGTSPEQ